MKKRKARVIKVTDDIDDMIRHTVWKLYQRGEISEADYNKCARWNKNEILKSIQFADGILGWNWKYIKMWYRRRQEK